LFLCASDAIDKANDKTYKYDKAKTTATLNDKKYQREPVINGKIISPISFFICPLLY